MRELCYFDNAATTFPKPPEVAEEMARCIREYCGNPGRGSHSLALKASEKLYEVREKAARMFSCSAPDRVVLTMNATHGLNVAILGLISPGSHILISDLEHNSVLRPVEYLKREKGVSVSVFSTKGNILENIRKKLREDTKALVCIHSSNITNKVLPIEKIGRLLWMRGIIFIVDASQSAGAHRIDVSRAHIDALCMPGHKGLLGPQGIGLAIFSERSLPNPIISGGSGSLSRLLEMPPSLPDRLEAGTLPTPCATGLSAGLDYISERGTGDILFKETELCERIKRNFMFDERVMTYSEGKGPLWLFNIRGLSSQKTAQLLSEQGVCVRPGLHCAPMAHKALNTPEDGAVRLSVGPMNTDNDGDRFITALNKILKN